ncbi:hypothetical protein B9T20_07910 [Wohlfahrtiimonas sp. G9077]|nr:hypothetical protein B9T20_07910 [Wohlfahrtiimonas sp. G9077]
MTDARRRECFIIRANGERVSRNLLNEVLRNVLLVFNVRLKNKTPIIDWGFFIVWKIGFS